MRSVFPGTPQIQPSTVDYTKQPQAEISSLSNGLTVASIDLKIPAAAIAVVTDSGIITETDDTAGATLFVERNVFKASENTSTRDVVAQLEDLGGTVTASTSRETLSVSADVLHQDIPNALRLISNGIFKSKFDTEEFEELRQQLVDENGEVYIDAMVPDMMYSLAYGNEPLGRTVIPEANSLSDLSREKVVEFRNRSITPAGTVVAITGVPHSQAVELVKEAFGNIPTHPTATPSPLGKSKYLGGNLFFKMTSEMEDPHSQDPSVSHICLAFEAPPVEDTSRMFAASLMSTILGGGDSFSSGGPGKGMYSRIYRDIMAHVAGLESCHAFYSSHVGTGLFGIHAKSEHGAKVMHKMLEILAVLYLGIIKQVSEEELTRAKNQLKSTIFMNLETRSILADDLARQVLYYRKRHDEAEMAQLINAITTQDIQRVAYDMIQTNPTLLICGKELPPQQPYQNYGTLLRNHGVVKEYEKKRQNT